MLEVSRLLSDSPPAMTPSTTDYSGYFTEPVYNLISPGEEDPYTDLDMGFVSWPENQKAALQFLRDIKSVTFSTVKADGGPTSRTMDVMIVDEEGLWFLTARGKALHAQLMRTGKVAICGMSKDLVAVRLEGSVKRIEGKEVIDRIFACNDHMETIYPGDTRYILEGFLVYKGKGDLFGLDTRPPRREFFCFGGETLREGGHSISPSDCTGCGTCAQACPTKVISQHPDGHFVISPSNCLECGTCMEVCPVGAVSKGKE
ncbi:hypothetical protein KIPB_006261 [Kipferlia bialata]|uniref:4Fe-4S ferredoxin-type domain-containing protein n=1 Tax=Kipferlia bialata TaxID=797122 RepID=A0A9K3CYK8_9EUKA|nr:hypothetical protein KIPB_006261 [Kipferlia bialata]|eukprot:g6261.t1